MKREVILIYLTVPDKPTGNRIVRQLLGKKLIACGNIFAAADSFFLWEGKLNHTKEYIVILKTTAGRFQPAAAAIKSMHPYDCPCILSLPVKNGFKPFMEWINKSVL